MYLYVWVMLPTFFFLLLDHFLYTCTNCWSGNEVFIMIPVFSYTLVMYLYVLVVLPIFFLSHLLCTSINCWSWMEFWFCSPFFSFTHNYAKLWLHALWNHMEIGWMSRVYSLYFSLSLHFGFHLPFPIPFFPYK